MGLPKKSKQQKTKLKNIITKVFPNPANLSTYNFKLLN